MTFQVPADLEPTILDAVQGGRFGSVNEAMTAAVRLLARELERQPATVSGQVVERPDLLTGSMRGHADEMDEIIADIYQRRQTDTWRNSDGE